MTIEIRRCSDPTHTENLISVVLCYNCFVLSDETGDVIGLPPSALADMTAELGFDQAMVLAQTHDKVFSGKHKIQVNEIDMGKIRDALQKD